MSRSYLNIPGDSYTPRGTPMTEELLALIDEREKANADELAALRQARDEDQARYAPKLTAEQADQMRRQIAEFDARERLAAALRPSPLTADELKAIDEDTTEFHAPIKAQITRAQIEGNTTRLILLQQQLLGMIQRDRDAAAKAASAASDAEKVAKRVELQKQARNFLATIEKSPG